MKNLTITLLAGALALTMPIARQAYAASDEQPATHGSGMMDQNMMSPGVIVPKMDAARGKQLFASKGCVVCHSINGVGGEDAPPLDAATMPSPMNPFDFAAKMWRGAEAMVALQREELGDPIELKGQELADLIAFVHDTDEQKTFSEADVPSRIKELMEHMPDENPHEEGGEDTKE
ncbi:cytochrome c [Aurantimonas sp. C2-6-R+9]|uniref:c-type cytochrome n=1 Tax=unclassified Aurantimonas TaxID=2638230 RepID=UPI002E175DBB|nr:MULTISPECIES: cytochrome c [unclassified Aurantimonas]MEC5292574.1 cytochrome c [Aurantimonas sp. C2-3-R2]MEC5382040.1 cytochrome c [Aurantimonas sp. C2-6-R+9]MEC5413630.1 cytochrome c [Aurantimonas sp. C2-4-R8]